MATEDVDPTNEAFRFMYHYDKMNAAVHMAPVKFSPLTFALAKEIVEGPVRRLHPFGPDLLEPLTEVMAHVGRYELDPGR